MAVFPREPRGFKFLFVAIDTFTKWMEAMPVVNIAQDVLAEVDGGMLLTPSVDVVSSDTWSDVRSILRMNTVSFRLVQALSWSNNPISSFVVLCYQRTMFCLPQMCCGLLLL
jgi:hypothetical protein